MQCAADNSCKKKCKMQNAKKKVLVGAAMKATWASPGHGEFPVRRNVISWESTLFFFSFFNRRKAWAKT